MTSPQPEVELDLNACAREPIQIPGSIQPHGVMFVVRDEDGRIDQVSASVQEHFGLAPEDLLGQPILSLLDPSESQLLMELFDRAGPESQNGLLTFRGRRCESTVHTLGPLLILELVPDAESSHRRDLYADVRDALADLRNATNIRHLAASAAQHVRRIGGFDRVMVYRFLEDDSGTVIAEDREPSLAPYLGLHYPASDIPAQARALYLKNWIRTIHDAGYQASPMVPLENPTLGEPLDMGRASLRSVSPIHREYLRNMGVVASMSVSLIRENRLWGLIACHHGTPWFEPSDVRAACELIGQIASMQIDTVEAKEEAIYRERAQRLQMELVRRMSEPEGVTQGLQADSSDLLDLVNATGAAVIHSGRITLLGATPTEGQVKGIIEFLKGKCWPEPFATDSLSTHIPEAAAYSSMASGLLAACHSQRTSDFVMWFRPEVVRTVTWAGNPHKPVEPTPGDRLRPRTSFAAWQETVSGQSRPWRRGELRAATDLRIAIMEREITALNHELELRVAERTEALQKAVDELNGFTYSVSHDLRTPLRGMVGHSRILVEEHSENLDRRVRHGLQSIEAAALKMSALVDSLLQYARLGRQEVKREAVDLTALTHQVITKMNEAGWPCMKREIHVADGMKAYADPALVEIILTTLLDNACKYRHRDGSAHIEVGEDAQGFYVYNRGIGFDMNYLNKVFEPFQRLHRDEEYPGTGIGLANARRIVERHGGRLWAEGEPGVGATFWFTL
jgi:light-regulated signal transduction histidine kinase (bacteriophytochrome)